MVIAQSVIQKKSRWQGSGSMYLIEKEMVKLKT